MSTLIIVESPAKARSISKYLGAKYKVIASVGHIKELPRGEIGIDFENQYSPRYVTIPGKEKVIRELKSHAKTCDRIILATDPDREGEAIAWHISNELIKTGKSIERALFNEINKAAIKRAVLDTQVLNHHLVQSQQARQGIDKIVGYKISPFLWKNILSGLSAGRVQSVALRLICERQEEIDAFKEEEFWSITAEFLNERSEKILTKLFKIKNEDFKISTEEEASSIIKDALARQYAISKIKTRDQKRNPPPPFTTSLLQQAASNKLGFGSKKTMLLAQKLYEGITIKGESIGLITYMRTDSKRISPSSANEAKQFIEREYGKSYLLKNIIHKTSAGSQDAHEAIRPTSAYRTPTDLARYLEKDMLRLYELIWKRFLASQMAPAMFNLISIDITDQDAKYLFRATGKKVIFDGFLKVFSDQKQLDYEERKSTKENASEETYSNIPSSLKEKDPLKLEHVDPHQHFTKPPPYYSEASLVKELDNHGIGRPSTYASIISTLTDRRYVEITNRKMVASELGKDVNKILIANFSDIFNVTYTAKMEEDLDKIATGKLNYQATMDTFYRPFVEALFLRESDPILPQNSDQTPCPKCEDGKRITKWTKRGKFYGCSNYPKCKHIESIASTKVEPPKTTILCPKCESHGLLLRKGRFGNFLACPDYPKCNGIVNLSKKDMIIPPKLPPIDTDLKCKKCSSPLYLREGTRGLWLGCSKFPKCRGRQALSTLPKTKQVKLQDMVNAQKETITMPTIKTIDGNPANIDFSINEFLIPNSEENDSQEKVMPEKESIKP